MEAHLARGLKLSQAGAFRESASRALRRYAERDGRGYPDWLMRYAPIVRRLRLDRRLDGLVLEIGANENGLARFADSGVRIVAVDIAREHLAAARHAQAILPIVADAAHLPFKDAAFAAVVAVDTLEHVPAPHRADCVHEIARVMRAGTRAALSFPAGAAAEAAESEVTGAYRDATGSSLRWFAEHSANGLPDSRSIADSFREALPDSHRISTSGNANIHVWKRMWRVLLGLWPVRGNAVAQVVLRAIAPMLARMHHGECYRTIVWAEPIDE